MGYGKGGLRAAFFFLPFSLVVLSYGVPFLVVIGGIRTAAFGAAAVWLWRRGDRQDAGSLHGVAVAVFVLLCVGHSFSSVYVWASLQHALNIGMAAVLLLWAARRFGNPSETGADALLPTWFAALAAFEICLAVYQRVSGGGTRPEGTFSNPVFLSEFLAMGSMVLAGRFLWPVGDRRMKQYAWGGGAVLLLASALSLTSSRGVALAIVPALVILLVLRLGAYRGIKSFLFLGIPALLVVGWHSFFRFDAMGAYHYGRWVFWRVALRIFREHPFGVGLGGYKFYWFGAQEPFPEAFRHYAKYAQTPHNEYLEVLTGIGFLGFLLFLLVIVPPVIVAAKNWKDVPESRRGVAAGAFSALVLSGVHALFNFNFHEAGIFCTDALLLGALLGCLPNGIPGRPVSFPSVVSKGGGLACGLLAAVSLSFLAGTVTFERGMAALRDGRMAAANRDLVAASKFDPLRSQIPDQLSGISYHRFLLAVRDGDERAQRHLEDSIRWQNRARALCPMEQAYPQRLAMLHWDRYRGTGDPSSLEASLASFDESLRINPYRVEAMWEKAFVLQEVGRHGEAASVLRWAVTVEPNFCRAYAKLAELSKGEGESRSHPWESRAAKCREAALGRMLEGNERWLVEVPRPVPGTK